MLNVANVSKIISGQTLFSNASFQIYEGEKVGLVGPNGAGKSTFFKMIVGEENPTEGQISLVSKTRISYFSQNVGEMHGKSALQEVLEGNTDLSSLDKKLKQFETQLCDPNIDPDEMNNVLIEMGEVQTEFEKLGGYELESNAKEILTGLGIGPDEFNKNVEDFSGGWKMRIALAKVLINLPDLILMDEPTNYLDLETIIWLEGWLKTFKGSVFMTSHDRDFMNAIVKKVIEVSNGRVTTFSGNYDFYEKEKELRKGQLEAQHAKQKEMLKKEEEFIAKFQARASHAAQVQSRVKKLDKIERIELEANIEQMSILLPELPRGGNDVVVIKDLSKSFKLKSGEIKKVFEGLSTTISRQDKLAVVGVNGAGKSTLLKIIANRLGPSGGECKIGPSINMGYFGQYSLEVLNPENTIFDEVQAQLPSASDGFIRNLLAAFLFKGNDVFKKIKYLSGGEKSRVILSYLLSQRNNLLLLDEPTNHLDIGSREVLLDALQRYEGTLLIVSHDRFFLKHLANKVLEVDKGEIHLYPGTYQEYVDGHSKN
ncbi:MAG: ABC-F family ATP-binding cassette domain-containing protein [Halobacteriovoraceae bacterium]|nr:ABC-F family ATP-binding cassette domain-containing protein [Halobacteriovoraceae bacterium]